ncbi:MAG: sigma-54-dependent transcriptional regulator [Bacteriovoracaceae bacterium]
MTKRMPLNILIIDDDELFRLGLSVYLERFGKVTTAETQEEAIVLLSKNQFDMAFIDLWMHGKVTGLTVVKEAHNHNTYPIILSSSDDEENIVQAYELGCKDYLIKANYRDSIDKLIEKYYSGKSESFFQKQILEEIITTDESLIKKISQAKTMLLNNKNLFIGGETGVGKTKLAALISQLSGVKATNFIHLNCAEIPETLVESELFGHAKGAFTGALTQKKGKLQLAHDGTLFLDEVATLSLSTQAKLLKAIEEKEFYPVGSNDKIKSSFKLISATCENLEGLVTTGKFRQDLYFRLANFKIDIKPLRERPLDIHMQLKHFIKKAGRQVVVSKEAKDVLSNYPWPGNTRELKSVAELLTLNDKGLIEIGDLPNELLKPSKNSMEKEENFLTPEQAEYIIKNGLGHFVKKVEKQITKKVFTLNEGKIRPTLKTLQVSSTTLYRILEESGLNTKENSHE